MGKIPVKDRLGKFLHINSTLGRTFLRVCAYM